MVELVQPAARIRRIFPAARSTPLILLAPALLVSLCFFVIPISTVAISSLSSSGAAGTGLSLDAYSSVIGDSFYWEVMVRTLRISILTTLAALIFGYPAALYLYFSQSKWRRLFLFIVVSPLFVSVIVRTYGWIILFSPNGAINAWLPEAGKIRLLQTEGAIVIGLTHIYIPFMVLSLNAALARVDKRLLTAAASLGATPFQTFLHILLPLSVSGLLSGSVIVFSISMTAFTTPILLGGAKNKTMAFLIYQENLLLSNWQLGSALAVILLAVTVVIVYFLSRAGDRSNAEMLPQ